MCDDLTAIEEQQALDARGIDRRSFAALGVASRGVLAAPLAAKAPAGLAEQMVTVTTPDGKLDAFFVPPFKGRQCRARGSRRGAGPYPGGRKRHQACHRAWSP